MGGEDAITGQRVAYIRVSGLDQNADRQLEGITARQTEQVDSAPETAWCRLRPLRACSLALFVLYRYRYKTNNRIEADHGRLKSRLRPMRGLTQLRCARMITTGHAFIRNIRRGHYELGIEEPTTPRVMAAFTELTLAI